MKKSKSLMEHMKNRNSMQQPKPTAKKPSYTAKDSAEAVGIIGRMKKDAAKWREGDVSAGVKLNERIDSLSRNPYLPTMNKREMEKSSNKGGTKSTKSVMKSKKK